MYLLKSGARYHRSIQPYFYLADVGKEIYFTFYKAKQKVTISPNIQMQQTNILSVTSFLIVKI